MNESKISLNLSDINGLKTPYHMYINIYIDKIFESFVDFSYGFQGGANTPMPPWDIGIEKIFEKFYLHFPTKYSFFYKIIEDHCIVNNMTPYETDLEKDKAKNYLLTKIMAEIERRGCF